MQLKLTVRPGTVAFCFFCSSVLGAGVSQKPETVAAQRQRESREYNESNREVVEQAWSNIIAVADKSDADKLRRVKIVYSTDETPLRFEADAGEQPILLVTTGGLRLSNVILEGYALLAGGYKDEEWFFQYMLYLRQQHLKHRYFHTATTAAGFTSKEQIKALNATYHWFYLTARQTTFFFALAHEAAHLLRNDVVEQADKESTHAFELRMREQEIRADRFAADLMVKHGQFVAGFTSLLVSTMLIYEPRESVSDATLHVPDRERLRAIAGWVRDAIANDSKVKEPDRSMMNAGLNSMLQVTEPLLYQVTLSFRDARLQHPIFDRLKLPESAK